MATSDVISNDGFDQNYYLAEKAAQLTQSTGQTWTVAQVQQAFDAAGLTAQEHYYEYGYAEGLSPNAYYNDDQYAASKAAEAGMTADEFRLAWYKASGSTNLYTHYVQYGAFESGVSPSSGFDDNAYYAAKAAHDGTTVDAAKSAIQSAGLNAISHYLLYGQYEGLSYTPSTTPSGTTQTLTLNQDNLSGSTFSAPLLNNGFGTLTESLQTGDTLTGTGANSVLNASLTNLAVPKPVMTNVGTVNLTAYANSALDASATTGTTTWADLNSNNSNLTINNIQELPSSLVMQNLTNGSALAVDIVNSAMAGSSDAMNLSLNGAGTATASSALTVTNTTGGTNVIETLNINTAGAASYLSTLAMPTSGTHGVATVNVTGSQDLHITNALDASVTTLNAADFTGKLDLNLSAAANPLTVTGGHGDDTLNLAAHTNVTVHAGDGNDVLNFGNQLDGLDVIDGGAGTNTLGVNISGQAVTGLQVSNIQNLHLNNATANGSIDLAGVSGIATLTLDASHTDNRLAVNTVDHAGSSVANINFTGLGTAGDGTAATNQFFNGVTFANSYSGTSDTVAVNINNNGTALHTGNTMNVGNLSLAGVEHLNLTVADGNATVGAINSSTMTDLHLNASGDLTTGLIGNLSTANTITSIDATGVTGHLQTGTISGLANGATVTLGNGGTTTTGITVDDSAHTLATDTVNVIGGTGADTINVSDSHGSVWSSFVTGGAAADTVNVTANTGVDTLNYTHLTDSIISTGYDNVIGFNAANDKFDVSAAQYSAIHSAGGFFSFGAASANSDLGTELGDVLTASGNTLVANGAAVLTINAGSANAGTYLVLNDSTAGFDATHDAVIHLTGTVGAISAADFV